MKNDKVRIIAIMAVSLCVLATGILFLLNSLMNGNILGGAAGTFITVIIFVFAVFVFIRGNRDLKGGFPLHDERSRKVIEKATSKAFFVSLYLLLAIGFLSEDIVHFRDVSQATGISVGIMAVLFAVFWVYYNRKGF
jgi:uncharacterized membrane protein